MVGVVGALDRVGPAPPCVLGWRGAGGVGCVAARNIPGICLLFGIACGMLVVCGCGLWWLWLCEAPIVVGCG